MIYFMKYIVLSPDNSSQRYNFGGVVFFVNHERHTASVCHTKALQQSESEWLHNQPNTDALVTTITFPM